MQISVLNNYQELSKEAANRMINQIKKKPASVICLASGETPLLTYQLFVKELEEQKIDYAQCTWIGLDEWVGVPPSNTGSCHYFLNHNIIQPLNLKPTNYRLFNGLAADLSNECMEMNAFIKSKGGIDIMVVGLGMNAHIGFNEPDIPFDLYAHVVELDKKTQQVGQKYFAETTTLNKGITLGLKHFMESGTAMLLVNGERKAAVVKKALEGVVSKKVPASIIRTHSNGQVLLDRAAATLLGKPVI